MFDVRRWLARELGVTVSRLIPAGDATVTGIRQLRYLRSGHSVVLVLISGTYLDDELAIAASWPGGAASIEVGVDHEVVA